MGVPEEGHLLLLIFGATVLYCLWLGGDKDSSY